MKSSIISRDESTALKGFLMLLIILGHCSLLTVADFQTGERYEWWHWLYSFHVYAFLLLPFLYGCNILNIKSYRGGVKKNLLRLYVPYAWFTAICTLIFCLFGGGTLNLAALGKAFVIGSENLLGESAGFNFLWFLPSMFAVLLYHNLYYTVKTYGKVILIVISVILWVVSATTHFNVRDVVPFALVQGCVYGLLGIITRAVLDKISSSHLWQTLSVVFFVLLSLLFFYREHFAFQYQRYVILFVMPIAFVVAIYQFRALFSKSHFLRLIGRYSLQMYLLHVIIYNILLKIICLFVDKTIIIGLIAYLLTLFISLGLAILMKRSALIMKLVFPENK